MCLSTVFNSKQKKAFLAKLPNKITVWKVVTQSQDGYETDCQQFPIHAGVVRFVQNIIHRIYGRNYRGGGHFFKTRTGARDWRASCAGGHVIRCVIKKEWINTVGMQCAYTVLVVKKAIFPSDMKVR